MVHSIQSSDSDFFLSYKPPLQPGPVLVDGSSHLAIVTTLTNTGDETLEILNDPETILSNLATDSFVIKNVEGTSPEFVGYMVGFHVPAYYDVLKIPQVAYSAEKAMASGQQEAFSTLKPGDSVKVTHHCESFFFSC